MKLLAMYEHSFSDIVVRLKGLERGHLHGFKTGFILLGYCITPASRLEWLQCCLLSPVDDLTTPEHARLCHRLHFDIDQGMQRRIIVIIQLIHHAMLALKLNRVNWSNLQVSPFRLAREASAQSGPGVDKFLNEFQTWYDT